MPRRYRHALPQLGDQDFLTDAGLETELIYHHGISLPSFAAFVLLERYEGQAVLTRYYQGFHRLAAQHDLGLVLETPTWRASRDWGERLGYSRRALATLNREAVGLLAELRDIQPPTRRPVVLSGNLGPRGDGYIPGDRMTAEEAADYHAEQIATFAVSDADLVSAFTLSYAEEGIGIARAARAMGMPVVLSFTVETDGRLPSGESLEATIERTDAATDGAPAYYMINCAHPSHFMGVLSRGASWVRRIRGVRANASRRSHAELDAATTLDDGNPEALGADYGLLRQLLPNLRVVGGCCGTDHRHVDAMVWGMRGARRSSPGVRAAPVDRPGERRTA